MIPTNVTFQQRYSSLYIIFDSTPTKIVKVEYKAETTKGYRHIEAREKSRYFEDVIFKCIFLNEKV